MVFKNLKEKKKIFFFFRYLLAVGLENGKILIYQSEDENQLEKWNELIEVDNK
jgi:hypothetical protein